ncbi:MAG: ABC transporter ATP-binding protein [Actinomycetota bacterium]|nr:ABC transporter ATP-binding protein [Actinomycetota bacterium]
MRVYTLFVENGAGIAVETVGLERVYGEGPNAVRALGDVSLAFPNGEFAAIMGPSGSGKSTLLHILGALDKPTSGRVVVGGTDLSGLSDRKLTLLRRERMGFVFQFFNLIPTLSAEENVLLPVLIAGKKPGNYGKRLDELLDLVGLTGRRTHRPDELSGGEQQRVAIARALIKHPDIILADEPTGNLDSRTGAEVLRLLKESAARFEQTILMVTHDPRAAATADRAVFLSDGRVVDEARDPDQEEILERIKTLESDG